MRERTAEAVLRLLGSRESADDDENEPHKEEPPFAKEERSMVSEVLSLADRPIRTIMTPRGNISWIDLNDTKENILETLRLSPHSVIPVCQGSLDDLLGVARAKDLLQDLLVDGKLTEQTKLKEPVVLHSATGVLKAMETLKHSDSPIALVMDEFGTLQGLITPIDILEAIAGEFPDEGEPDLIKSVGDGAWLVAGTVDLRDLEKELEVSMHTASGEEHAPLSRLLLTHFGRLPEPGEAMELHGYRFEVTKVVDRQIAAVKVSRPAHEDQERSEPGWE